MKKTWVAELSTLVLLCTLSGVAVGATADAASGPIKIGLLEDSTGDFAAAGIPKVHGVELAVSEINARGGVLGRKLKVIYYDTQSDNRRYQEFARRLILQDKVDVLFGAFSSASREAIRPIADRYKQLYFYNNEYEGGVCDKNMFLTGIVPDQVLSKMVPYMVKKFGPKVYTIAADYNFGQISAEWIRKFVEQSGGKMVGQEFIPLSVSQFNQTISNIQAAKPDVLITLMIGANQVSFFQQAAAANLTVPMASFVNGPTFYEHKQLPPPAMNGMYIAANYMEEIDTPASDAFKKAWHAKFPSEKYINQVGEDSYVGVYLYAHGVKKAGTTNQAAVIKALESPDTCIEAPEGKVCVDPRSHHLSHTISMMQVEPNHSLKRVEVWADVEPSWLGDAGCNLPVKSDHNQYTPSNPPRK
ncbi:MAG: urea ABC transporter substrate-binding protein [Candidimonas sp.]|nr:MAG: urea ABC transporter substrate-binding protein [Candidimonas sp.]